MNPVERAVRRVDAAQQRHRVSAFIFGVIKKYGDDNGGVLAANMAHSAFVSVFPLLLILVTVLVQVASSSPALQAQVLANRTQELREWADLHNLNWPAALTSLRTAFGAVATACGDRD